jgi:hypothetical protein
MKRQLAFSLVLATLSFIVTKAIESYGVDQFYEYQATHFQKESGYFDLQHPVSIQYLPTGLIPFSEISSMDSLHVMAMQGHGLNGLVRLNADSNSFSIISPLKSTQHLSAFVQVDSTLYLFDDRMDVYTSRFPYDSSSTRKISQERPNWKSNSACFHQATHRIYFNPEVDHPETNRLRAVYTFNLNKNRFISEPLFSYDVDAVERFASEHGIRIHANRVTALRDTVLGLTVIPSAIAVHPKTNEVYILSAVDHSLVVFDQFGVITNYSELDSGLFPNPTGLTFAQNGDLLISNEDYIKNSIVRISWNKLWQSKGGKGLVFGR